MTKGFLPKVYNARNAAETRTLYDEWADSYDAEVSKNGYATPDRCALALAAYMPDMAVPVLDFGCSTGISGLALHRAGFATVDGLDLSAEMLRQAAAKGFYRQTILTEPDEPPAIPQGAYAAIAAIGVIGAGAAPVSIFDPLLDALNPGGKLVWSFNDHSLEDPENEAKVNTFLATGKVKLLFKDHGPHLPRLDMGSNIYVIEKT